MADLTGYDANNFEPAKAFDAIPAGDYPVIIVESSFELTKNAQQSGNENDGKYLKLKLQVIEGPHKGRTLFDQLNIKNPNEQTVKIALATLSAICRAVGRMKPRDSSELHNIPLIAKVIQDTYKGEQKNKVRGYKPIKPVEVGTPKVVEPEVVGKTKEKAPWER